MIREKKMRRHLMIAGTGRSGTSFLVRYLASLGLETHLSRSENWHEEAEAGLEDLILHGGDLPYVIKSPWLYQHIDLVLSRKDIKLDGVIVPTRDIVEASVSRTTIEMQNTHRMLPFLADEARMWDTHAHTPGGVIFSLNPLDQARLLAMGFHKLLCSLTQAEVPVYLVAFPRMIHDCDYLIRSLRAVFPSGIDEENARESFRQIADASKVRTSDELAAHKSGTAVTAKFPSSESIELAALKREIKRLRRELSREAPHRLSAVELASEEYVSAVPILPDTTIVQRFRPAYPLGAIATRLVTFGKTPARYPMDWQVVARVKDRISELGRGQIDSGTARDWQAVQLPLAATTASIPDQIEVSFRTRVEASSEAPVGIPLYRPAIGSAAPPAEIGGHPDPSGAQIGLILSYRL
jgi:hypothetical protein